MTRDILRCKCGKPVGLIRLNGRVLSLLHDQRDVRHPVRLSRPASEPVVPAAALARTEAPHGEEAARTGASRPTVVAHSPLPTAVGRK